MSHDLVCAKTFWGIGVALRALEQQSPAEILENRRISAKKSTGAAVARDPVLKIFQAFTLEISRSTQGIGLKLFLELDYML